MARVTGQRGRNLKTRHRESDRGKGRNKRRKSDGPRGREGGMDKEQQGTGQSTMENGKKAKARSREDGGIEEPRPGAGQRDTEEDQKTNETKPVMGYKMGWGKPKTAPGSWTQRDGDRQTNSVGLQGAEGRIKH